MGRLANLFDALDRADGANPKCRDCRRCIDRTESHGMCFALNKHVAYIDPVNGCYQFSATRLRNEVERSEAGIKYGHLKARTAVARVKRA